MNIQNNKLYWYRSANFGDQLSKYIYNKITGNEAIYVDGCSYENKYILTGSLLSAPLRNCKIIGAGFVDSKNKWIGEGCDIRMVRGYLSQKKINSKCLIGEPTHAMPFIYNPKIEPFYEIGFIPHLVDFNIVFNRYKDDFLKGHALLIDFNQRYSKLDDFIENTINRIKLCKHIVSSSLHGCIIANVYGIPFTWVRFSDELIGDGFKFIDYMSSVNIIQDVIDLRETSSSNIFKYLIDKSSVSSNCDFDKMIYEFLKNELICHKP